MLTKILSKDSSLFFAVTSTIGVLVLSLINSVPQPENFTISDKTGHFVAYFTITFFWLIFSQHFSNKRNHQLLVFFACIFYGIIIEIMQHVLTATRTASVLDVLANTIGCSLALFLVLIVKKKVNP